MKQIFLQVQVIFTIAWKKQISGEPNLTGVLPSSPPTTDLFLTLLQRLVPTASLIRVRPLVAVSQGWPVYRGKAGRGREKQALDSVVSVEVKPEIYLESQYTTLDYGLD